MTKKLPILLTVATLSGCTAVSLPPSAGTAPGGATLARDAGGGVREHHEPMLALRAVPARHSKGPVSLAATDAEFGALVSEVARQNGFSASFAESVDWRRRITVELRDAHAKDALRQLAFSAGYVAVIDEQARTVQVANDAVYTFKLPAVLFAARDRAAVDNLVAAIKDVAGRNAEVAVADSGLVVVRANAQALNRTHGYLRKLAAEAMTQVDIEAAVLEVAQDGRAGELNWEGVLAAVHAAGGAQLAVTPASVSTVVATLRQNARVRMLANPRLTVLNQQSATLFAGHAAQRASLSVTPFAVDARTAQLRLAPTVGAGPLDSEAAEAASARVTINAENGQTTIIRGLRLADSATVARELVIVLRASVVPARTYDPLVGESL
jgi:type II secretory pathway component GspD/PulD (secretin)